MDRCMYCRDVSIDEKALPFQVNKKEELTTFEYCSTECREAIEDFVAFSNNNLDRFVRTGFALLLGLIVALIIAKSYFTAVVYGWILGLGLVALGILFFRYPFATWGVYQRLGIKNATRILRIIAVLIIVIGCSYIYLLYV